MKNSSCTFKYQKLESSQASSPLPRPFVLSKPSDQIYEKAI